MWNVWCSASWFTSDALWRRGLALSESNGGVRECDVLDSILICDVTASHSPTPTPSGTATPTATPTPSSSRTPLHAKGNAMPASPSSLALSHGSSSSSSGAGDDATVASVAGTSVGTAVGSDTDAAFPAQDEPGSEPADASTSGGSGPLLVALVVVGVVGVVLGVVHLRRRRSTVEPQAATLATSADQSPTTVPPTRRRASESEGESEGDASRCALPVQVVRHTHRRDKYMTMDGGVVVETRHPVLAPLTVTTSRPRRDRHGDATVKFASFEC